MRVYLPATLPELQNPRGLPARNARAATAALMRELGPQADEEAAEYVAMLRAAQDSIALIGTETGSNLARRLVVAAEVPANKVTAIDDGATIQVGDVTWDEVVSFHVDEAVAASQALVAQAATGDPDAFKAAAELDLLWYDVSERAELAGD